jgi:SpoVK/Ycf46/Vps4 family AAA+-type ATPase
LDVGRLLGRQLRDRFVAVGSHFAADILGTVHIFKVLSFQVEDDSAQHPSPVREDEQFAQFATAAAKVVVGTEIVMAAQPESFGQLQPEQHVGVPHSPSTLPPYLRRSYDGLAELAHLGVTSPKHDIDTGHTIPAFPDTQQPLASRGILVHGLSGVGKSTLVRALCKDFEHRGVRIFSLFGPSLVLKHFGTRNSGAVWASFRTVFQDARRHAPAIVIIDDMDVLIQLSQESENSDGGKPSIHESVSEIMRSMETLAGAKEQVVVIGVVANLREVPAVLRRVGRFDRDVRVTTPTEADRRELLTDILSPQTQAQLSENNSNLPWISSLGSRTAGFVLSDFQALMCNVYFGASIRARHAVVQQDFSRAGSNRHVQRDVFRRALQFVRPSQLLDLDIRCPSKFGKGWKHVGGYTVLKDRLQHLVNWQWQGGSALDRLGCRKSSGILLHGPSGCGKTLLATVLARESQANFVRVKMVDLFSKYLGETERAIRTLFARARIAAPSILFFDELDALAAKREFDGNGGGKADDDGGNVYTRALSTLLNEMDGIEGANANAGVLVLAASNRRDALDPALLRPGRFDHCLYVAQPSGEDRLGILTAHCSKLPMSDDVQLAKFADDSMSAGFSGATLGRWCTEAALLALRADINACCVCEEHFLQTHASMI